MHNIDDEALDRLTSRELLELQARIHEAIRAHIRLKNAQKAAAAVQRPAGPAHLPQVEQIRQRSLAVHARTRQADEAAARPRMPAQPSEQPRISDDAFDLERERDAWIARKKSRAG